jgi:hypothetical protein
MEIRVIVAVEEDYTYDRGHYIDLTTDGVALTRTCS